MNSLWNCDKCNKKWKTFKGFNNHKCKNRIYDVERDDVDNMKQVPIKKKRKKKISPLVRFEVWETYIGNMIETKCFCCWNNKITPFTYCNTFHAGHITSEANGGEIKIGNLLPICSDCNSSMGTLNWDEYIEKYTNFRVRIYGDNLSKKAIKNALLIQKCYKKYKQNKKNKQKLIKKRKKKIPNYLKPTISSLKKNLNK